MSDILMPGQGGKRNRRKMTANEVHNELVEVQTNLGQFARAVGNDFQQFQALFMALLDQLGLTEEYECKKCDQKEIMIPKLDALDIIPACPLCGEDLVDDETEEE
jgi:hypothetical protein